MELFELLGILGVGLVVFIGVRRAQRRMEETRQGSTTLALAGAISVLVAWGVARYFHALTLRSISGEQADTLKPGYGFRAVVHEQIKLRPLALEVDFLDIDVARTPELLPVETPRFAYVFETTSAALVRQAHKRRVDGKASEVTLFEIDPSRERELSSFLLAFEQETPLSYRHVGTDVGDDATTVSFTAETPKVAIEKIYVLEHRTNRIDMTIRLNPQRGVTVNPRLLVAGPWMPDMADDATSGIVWSDRDALESSPAANLEGRAWIAPTLFGSTDKYFVQALVADPSNFVMRAYYRLHGAHRMSSILEGPEVSKAQEWKLSFYIGPKVLADMKAVDVRLVDTLNYGWFHSIAVVLKTALDLIHDLVQRYGISIILFVILVKLMMLPLSISAEKGRLRAAEMEQRRRYIERKYKDQPEVLERERMELLRKFGVGDMLSTLLLGIVGVCVMIGIQRVLATSYELYRAPFLWWISDLSAADGYMILPVITVIAFGLRMKSGSGPVELVQRIVFSLVMFAMASYFSAGLLLALATMTWFDVIQGWIQQRYRQSAA